MQDSDTSDLIFDVAALITTASQAMTLGDIIATGTPAGVDHARKPPVWLRQGETIEVEGIGVATNRIARRTARG